MHKSLNKGEDYLIDWRGIDDGTKRVFEFVDRMQVMAVQLMCGHVQGSQTRLHIFYIWKCDFEFKNKDNNILFSSINERRALGGVDDVFLNVLQQLCNTKISMS